ncbi:MAG: 30S ribosomal protein S9 [Candidatus Pacebacteria bacterium]|nr:30S ribosomal protein S9 [Candidatus Paceibacterota bacterium]MDR3583166.1 30S ribosomal protein S9 [Candidatus Paceibacterota bacterium]
MATKKVTKKEEATEKKETAEKGKYFYAVGRRKTAVAKIKLYESKGSQNTIVINERALEKYFPLDRLSEVAKSPLALAGEGSKFEAVIRVLGGGVNAQAEAIRLGISRALVVFDETLKKSLKDKKFLTRDSREVERKKAGLKKARKSPQWAKR